VRKANLMLILTAILVISGCAKVVTVKDTFGDLFTVSVNLRGNISIDEKYYLILSEDSNFQVPEEAHEFEEPYLISWSELLEEEKTYLLNRFSTWTGYIVVDSKDIYRVQGPFTTTEEAKASQEKRVYITRAGDFNNLSFDFRIVDIFGSGLSLGESVYFDIITTTLEADDIRHLADRLTPGGNYIRNEKNAIVSGSDEASSVEPSLDILDWVVSIQ